MQCVLPKRASSWPQITRATPVSLALNYILYYSHSMAEYGLKFNGHMGYHVMSYWGTLLQAPFVTLQVIMSISATIGPDLLSLGRFHHSPIILSNMLDINGCMWSLCNKYTVTVSLSLSLRLMSFLKELLNHLPTSTPSSSLGPMKRRHLFPGCAALTEETHSH